MPIDINVKSLNKKVGPLPLWAWAGISAILLVLAYRHFKKGKAAKNNPAATDTTLGGGNSGFDSGAGSGGGVGSPPPLVGDTSTPTPYFWGGGNLLGATPTWFSTPTDAAPANVGILPTDPITAFIAPSTTPEQTKTAALAAGNTPQVAETASGITAAGLGQLSGMPMPPSLSVATKPSTIKSPPPSAKTLPNGTKVWVATNASVIEQAPGKSAYATGVPLKKAPSSIKAVLK